MVEQSPKILASEVKAITSRGSGSGNSISSFFQSTHPFCARRKADAAN